MKNSHLGGRGKVTLNRKRATSCIFIGEKRRVSTKQEHFCGGEAQGERHATHWLFCFPCETESGIFCLE